jgi:PilZ domain
MTERRKHPRAAASEPALIMNNFRSVLGCTILNVGDGGACLETPAVSSVPDTFDLIRAEPADAHACRVIWRAQARVGVAFL